MEEEKILSLLKEAKKGDYDSAMQIVGYYKKYATSLMIKLKITDKVSCYDEIVRTILNAIIKF